MTPRLKARLLLHLMNSSSPTPMCSGHGRSSLAVGPRPLHLGVNSIDILDGLNSNLNPSLNCCPIQSLPKRVLNLVLNLCLNISLKF